MHPDGCPQVGRSRRNLFSLVCLSLLLGAAPAQAIIFYTTGDPNYNTTAPGGTLANSGWQFEGIWENSYLGTPIAPRYFITASHFGGSVGDLFTLNGTQYTTTAFYDDPDSDLRIWRVCGSFAAYAPLYTNSNEINKSLVVIGRGTQRGAVVTTSTTNLLGQVTVKTNGWQWGTGDGVVRWGENTVASVVNGDSIFGSGIGDMLQASFDAGAGGNECQLSVGDSGGAVFIKDGSTWKLAGINYAADGTYNTSNSGAGFNAAIYDERGLYKMEAGAWVLPPDLFQPQPGSFYATRISAHVSWINSIIGGPGPGDGPPTLQSSGGPSGPYADEFNAAVDDVARTVTIALPAGSRFYRLRACDPLTLGSIRVQGGNLVL